MKKTLRKPEWKTPSKKWKSEAFIVNPDRKIENKFKEFGLDEQELQIRR